MKRKIVNKTKDKITVFKKSGKLYALGFAMILAIAFVHFVAQVFFIQNKTSQSVETAVEIALPVEPVIIPESENYEPRKIEAVTLPETMQPKMRRRTRTIPTHLPTRKQVAVESRNERLRRAERILTGI